MHQPLILAMQDLAERIGCAGDWAADFQVEAVPPRILLDVPRRCRPAVPGEINGIRIVVGRIRT